jgi:hypothetical protein
MVSLPGAIGYMAVGWDKTGLPPYSIGFVSIAAVLLLMPASLLTARLGALVANSALKASLGGRVRRLPYSCERAFLREFVSA